MSDVMQALRSADAYPTPLTLKTFALSQGVPNVRERVATKQFNRAHALREDVPIQPAVLAYERFQADATGGEAETFNLSNSLTESGATDEAVAVYADGSRVSPTSYSVENDTVTVTAAANATVDVFYACDEQARIIVAKTAPGGNIAETLWSGDVGLLHARDHAKEPVYMDLSASALQPVIPTDWTLDVYVQAPYTAAFAADVDDDGDDERAGNALLDFGARATQDQVPGLDQAVRDDSARR